MPAKNYYATLGVPRNASDDDIKRAYRNLARRHHPDVTSDQDKLRAESHFKDINEAYAVLSDAKKRAHYDRFGSLDGQMGPNTGAPGEGFNDIFDFFFGGGMGRHAGPARGSDLRYDIHVGLEDILTGA
ncbi:MAG: DnaJ domain-containing protein, partial [Candidatus Eremiobacteraeota bacterium]|nr:DnaJ domain-containing protein [Candidatus Eremiobacteraeota bacterium]